MANNEILDHKKTIIMIDDCQETLEMYSNILSSHFNVLTFHKSLNFIEYLKQKHPVDLFLLDVDIPKINGLELFQKIRSLDFYKYSPILFLSGWADSDTKTKAFELGIDDYIIKPIISKELIARINNQLRKSSNNLLKYGPLKLNLSTYKCCVDKIDLSLTQIEFKLLYKLISMGKLVPRNDLMLHVWEDITVGPRVLNTHLSNLRSKVELYNISIESIKGKGVQILNSI